MVEEKNSLLGYLVLTPGEQTRVFCRDMDRKQHVSDYTLGDAQNHACNLGKYLQEMGQKEPYIPIFVETSYDFLRSFFGVLAGKKVCVPIHTTANEATVDYVLRKVRAGCVIVTQPWLYRKLANMSYVREHIHAIFTTPEIIREAVLPCKHIDVMEIFNRSLSPGEAQQYLQDVVAYTKPDDPLQIVFTSGTTGQPKGAILSHKNVVSCVVRAGKHLGIDSEYRTLTFLPLSHVMGQNEVFIGLVNRAIVQIVGRENMLQGLKSLKPNILVSVPRVYQAIHQGIQKKLRNKPLAQKLINTTVNIYTVQKRSPSFPKRMLAAAFSKTIGRILTHKIRENLGKFKLLVTAGASCPEYIYDFYEAIGMPLTNAQGLTEVSGAIIYNEANETLQGSIGYPLPGMQAKIDNDGEILMKGDMVFCGYFDEPESTQNSFTSEGWFRTGDLGKVETIRGKKYLFLEGRKKEIVVLTSGVNVTPGQIEEKLVQNEIIQQAVIVGDGKPRLGALIVPHDEHTRNENLREEVSKIIRQVNTQIETEGNEKIGNFAILPEPFTVENGMLTPTLKMVRPVIFQRYKEIIGRLYSTPA